MQDFVSFQFRYKESHLKEKGHQVGLRCVQDDPKMVHSLAASKLQSNLEYTRQSKEDRARYQISADQPEFIHAKKSQAQASDLTYRRKLHDYTCDPEQLTVKHAKQAYKLQSDVRLLEIGSLVGLTYRSLIDHSSRSVAGQLQVGPELDQRSGLDPSRFPQGGAGPPGCRTGTG